MIKKKQHDDEPKVLRKSYKFAAYPYLSTRRRLRKVIWCGPTLAWNRCIGERLRILREYNIKCQERMVARVSELGRELASKELKILQREVAKVISWPNFYSQRPKFATKMGHPEYDGVPSTVLEMTAYSADASWKSFMRQRQNGDLDARPPRTQYPHASLVFRQSGWRLDGKKLTLTGIGTIPIRKHRDIEGKIKTVTITEKNERWYVCFSCEITDFPGACGSVPRPNANELQVLWQKYAPSDGVDPENGGTHNRNVAQPLRRPDGVDPENGGTHNSGDLGSDAPLDGVDPKNGGTHNDCSSRVDSSSDGVDPEKPTNKRICTIHFLSGELFLATSDGHIVMHPGFYEKELETITQLNQSLARKKKMRGGPRKAGDRTYLGRNRARAKLRLARWHEHITRKREYWLWGLARLIAMGYDEVVVYELPIKQTIQYAINSEQARRLCDGARARFLSMLEKKCRWFGTKFNKKKGTDYAMETALAERIRRHETARAFIFQARKAVKYDSVQASKKAKKKLKQLIKENEDAQKRETRGNDNRAVA